MFFLIAVQATAQIPSTLGWYEVPNTKIDPVCQNGFNTCWPVPYAWGGGIWDSLRGRMIIWGGGHNDYGGNEVYALQISGTPGVARIANNTNPSSCSLDSCDGGVTPNSRHSYDNLAYIPTIDSMFVFGGSAAGDGRALRGTWLFHFATNTWQNMNPTGTIPEATLVAYTYYDSSNDRVIVHNVAGGLYAYDVASNSYTRLGDIGGTNGYGGTGVIDPIRKRFYVFGSGESSYYNIDSSGTHNRTAVAVSGPWSSIVAKGYPGIDYDPVADRLVAWIGGDSVYVMNPTDHTSTSVAYAGGPVGNNVPVPSGTFGRWRYSSALGVFLVMNEIDVNVWSFRLSSGTPDTAAPTAPTSLSATSISQSQINLSWTVSTDAVGVTGYRVERCGNPCSDFVEIGTPTTPSYADVGLTASTTFGYRVRARDAAGNNSGYSATVNATTATTSQPPPSTLTVGPGKLYATVCAANAAAQDGNTLEIDAGVYPNENCVVSKALTLKGIGGYAHLKWGTGDSLTNTTVIPNGKAILIIQATTTIEGLEFSGAKVADENGAGIRYEGGDLTIRKSYFHGNENGILGQGTASNTLTIENNIFSQDGFCGGGGCGHNLYVGNMGRLIFRFNKSIDSRDGSHTLKSRALVNEVSYNFLSTKNSDGSYESDFPNGGTVYYIGNVVEQGANTSNSTVLSWGAEGASNPNPALYVINNTFNNMRTSGATFIQVNGLPALGIKNNVFAGGGTMLAGATTDLSTNKTLPLTDFVNAPSADYHLVAGSTAIDAGVNPGAAGTYGLMPLFEYREAADKVVRQVASALDLGAYESGAIAVPPPSDVCTSDPLTITSVKWPTAQTGNRSISYNSGRKKVSTLLFTWPGTLTVTDDRGCKATVIK